jgi:hypothetical protein
LSGPTRKITRWIPSQTTPQPRVESLSSKRLRPFEGLVAPITPETFINFYTSQDGFTLLMVSEAEILKKE